MCERADVVSGGVRRWHPDGSSWCTRYVGVNPTPTTDVNNRCLKFGSSSIGYNGWVQEVLFGSSSIGYTHDGRVSVACTCLCQHTHPFCFLCVYVCVLVSVCWLMYIGWYVSIGVFV